MRTVAVIQARAGSTRFPGKVLADLCGRPLLAHVVDRARLARCLDDVVVATTEQPGDDAVAALAMRLGARVVRGPEDDVLSRYVMAAREHNADIIVRITADCPLLEPRLVDRVVRLLGRANAEYACNILPPSYPDGYDVEAVTAECLRRLDAESMRPYEREHVTARVRENLHEYRVATIRCRRDLSALRLTVDVPADLELMTKMLSGMPGSPPPGLGAVLARIARDPSLADVSGLPQRDERYVAQREVARSAEVGT